MRSSFIILALAALAVFVSAQLPLALPPDVPFVNAQNVSLTATFQGVPVTGSGPYQYLNTGGKTVQHHAKLTVSAMGQTQTAESWVNLVAAGSGWTLTGATSQNGQCKKTVSNQNSAAVTCSAWGKSQVASQWTQKCSVSVPTFNIGLVFTASTNGGQLNQFGVSVLVNGSSLANMAMTVVDQTSTAPAASDFQIPASCVAVPPTTEKRTLEIFGFSF